MVYSFMIISMTLIGLLYYEDLLGKSKEFHVIVIMGAIELLLLGISILKQIHVKRIILRRKCVHLD